MGSNPSQRTTLRRPMNPASTMKLVTAFAALELLGPTYTWKTEAHLLGPLAEWRAGRRSLIEGFWGSEAHPRKLLAAAAILAGARSARDPWRSCPRSHFFRNARPRAGAFDGDALRPYNVGADALLVNYKAIRFFFLLDPVAQGVTVVAEPKLAHLEITSTVKLADGPCGDWRARLNYDVQSNGKNTRAIFAGSLPASCGERVWNLAPLTHSQYVFGAFKALWLELGGELFGGVREGQANAGCDRLRNLRVAERSGRAPRHEQIQQQRDGAAGLPHALGGSAQAARTLRPVRAHRAVSACRTRAAHPGARHGKWLGPFAHRTHQRRRARQAARCRVPQRGDAGIHRHDAARRLRRHHEAAAQVRKRRRAGAHQDRIARRRTLLAGYIRDRNGRRFAVVFFVNHPNAGASQGAQDALLRWVYEEAR